MRQIVIVLLGSFFGACCAAEPESISKQDIVAAFRELRTAVALIGDVHSAMALNRANDFAIPDAKRASYRLAQQHLEKSIKLNPYYPEAYVFLANSHWELDEDLDTTLRFYSRAIQLDPSYDAVISARGYLFVQLQRIADAEKDLKLLEQLNSKHAASLREDIAVLKTKAASRESN